ncbi:MAG: phytoene desaturase [Myxococcales bacterium]|nr:phytoene desaturase [Myxococcales bacterium]
MKKVIIVGSGIGGLSAAICLASRGYQVTVLEAHNQAGGKAGTVNIQGVEADTGPSILTLPAVFAGLFEMAGRCMHKEITLLKPSPCFRYIYPDGVNLDIFHDIHESLDSVNATLGSKSRRELEAFLVYAERIWKSSADIFVYGDAPSFGSMLKLGLRGMYKLRSIDATRSMAKSIGKYISNPHLRDLLLRYATYNGSNPFKAPGTLNCIAHVELELGGYGIKGGIYFLVQRLVALIEELGGSMRYQARVEEITVDGQQGVTGVRLANGESLRADAVIANAEPEHVFRNLLPVQYRPSPRSSAPSTSGWTGLLQGSPSAHRIAHVVIFPDNYEDEFTDLFEHRRTPRQPTIYLCDQTLAHERASWPNHHPVFVMVNAPSVAPPNEEGPDLTNEGSSWDASTIQQKLASLQLCDSQDPFIWQRTPQSLAKQFPGSYGSIYGAASNSVWSAFQRPSNRVKHPSRLYLASGGAHPGGGLPLCAASGKAAAKAVIQDLGEHT